MSDVEKWGDDPKLPYDRLRGAAEDGGLDSRQRKLLRRLLEEFVSSKGRHMPPPERGENTLPWLRRTWDRVLRSYEQQLIYRHFQHRDKELAPLHRDTGVRFRKVRLDRKLSIEEFRSALHSPFDEEPFPLENLAFSATQIRDLEYGTRPFDNKIAALVFHKFGISGEWLLEGRGTPHTRTGLVTMPRIISIEERLTRLEDQLNVNVGVDGMEQLHRDKNPIIEETDGKLRLRGGSNVKIRVDLNDLIDLVGELQKRLNVQQDLLSVYKKELERLEALTIAGL